MPSGQVLLDGTLGHERAELQDPPRAVERASDAAAPSVRARSPARARLTVAVSWNGATDVVVAGGCSPAGSRTSLAPAASAAKSGFETTHRRGPRRARGWRSQALDEAGAVLGTSPPLKA